QDPWPGTAGGDTVPRSRRVGRAHSARCPRAVEEALRRPPSLRPFAVAGLSSSDLEALDPGASWPSAGGVWPRRRPGQPARLLPPRRPPGELRQRSLGPKRELEIEPTCNRYAN
ncbi:unnamed protein product, partial [Rangifer tarandus platyrhynchus]